MKKTILPILFILVFVSNVYGASREVDDNGGKDYSTINEAIEDASCGDSINIYAGTYNENVSISGIHGPGNCSSSAPLKIQSVEPGVIIDGGSKNNCVEIYSDYVEWDNTVNDPACFEGDPCDGTYRIELRNCGKAEDNPDANSDNVTGIYILNTRDYIVRGFNLVSSGSGPNASHMFGDRPRDLGLAWTNGVKINQNRKSNTRPDWAQISDITIDCNECFGTGFNAKLAQYIKISNIKVIDSGTRYSLLVYGCNDFIIEKSYFNYSVDVRDNNSSQSGIHRIRGGVRLRELERMVFRHNIVDNTGSAGQMVGAALISDEDSSEGFNGEGRQEEEHEIYNNIFKCDYSPDVGAGVGCIIFSSGIADTTFVNNIINTSTAEEDAIDLRYVCDTDITITNTLFGNSTILDDNCTASGEADIIVENCNAVGDSCTSVKPTRTDIPWMGGEKPIPYYRLSTDGPTVDTGTNDTDKNGYYSPCSKNQWIDCDYTGTDFVNNALKNGRLDIGALEYDNNTSVNNPDQVPPAPPVLIAID